MRSTHKRPQPLSAHLWRSICRLALVAMLLCSMHAVAAKRRTAPQPAQTVVEPGVSRQLATQRKATLSNIAYHLGFTVPEEKAQKVTFADTITFCYTPQTTGRKRTKTDHCLQIDFQGQLTEPAIVNGKPMADITVSNEHIVIPESKLAIGNNTLIFRGMSLDDKLNRQPDYLYTLFVPAGARSAFPCFDQPDLKAHFHLSLHLPQGWTSVASHQGDSHPISTYLFSFAAGRFQEQTAQRSGRQLRALYRETDSAKVAQLPAVFNMVDQSIRWMEAYTGIAYPFDRYEMVMLPGYQFGGMEHPGAIQYKASTIFLNPEATTDDELRRLELIAHETAHMWFGDLVTMAWFDDVWTKEVFANFMAEKISREVFPHVNRQINMLKNYQLPAISTDRTLGTHPIQQQLSNLNAAGLLYGNIIYYKAPVMMNKLEQQMGEQLLREGLRRYLLKYSYGNATWDDLIHELCLVAPQARLEAFSQVWVKEKGMPFVETRLVGTDSLEIAQHDPWGRGLVWPQTFRIQVVYPDSTEALLTFATEKAVERVALPKPNPSYVVPSPDGSGYGRFVLSTADADSLTSWLSQSCHEEEATRRLSALSMLHDQWLMHRLDGERLARLCLKRLEIEENSLVFSQTISFLSQVVSTLNTAQRHWYEQKIFALCQSPVLPASMQRQLKRAFFATFSKPELVDSIYAIWKAHEDAQLAERNYTAMAYMLALRRPTEWQHILDTQLGRLKTDDERSEFLFVSRACNPSADERQKLFCSLKNVENRRVEPWARSLLALLCHESHGEETVRYLEPALDLLPEIQQTGDIFFPTGWLTALLSSQHSEQARTIVEAWIEAHEHTLMPALMNKLKEKAFYLSVTEELRDITRLNCRNE